MSVLIAQFQGVGPISAGVEFFTNSIYSHSALMFTRAMCIRIDDDPIEGYATAKEFYLTEGSVIEAWSGGVQLAPSLSTNHHPKTRVDLFELKVPLTEEQEQKLAEFACRNIGKKYDYWNVARFVPVVRLVVPKPPPYSYNRTHIYCSELVVESFKHVGVELLERCEAWTIPPRDVARSPLIKPAGYVDTF